MKENTMSRVPIATQLRAHGLREALPGEESGSFPVAIHYRDQSVIVHTMPLPAEPDHVMVETMRGFVVSVLRAHKGITLARLRIALVNYSENIGATDAEVVEASIGLEKLVPERSPVLMRLLNRQRA